MSVVTSDVTPEQIADRIMADIQAIIDHPPTSLKNFTLEIPYFNREFPPAHETGQINRLIEASTRNSPIARTTLYAFRGGGDFKMWYYKVEVTLSGSHHRGW